METAARATIVPQRCLKCGADLLLGTGRMECSSCNSAWPLINGVPSYASAKYFGEMSRADMRRLLVSAGENHWREAARRHFWDSNPDMYYYIADLNRAAWIPLLPLIPESTVLDVGAGLGAITHALALNYSRVVALEPIEERLAFTKIRCDQEGLQNVELIQTTVTALPFFENTFDLIVLNGILEWTGEWRRDLPPRDAQLETLRDLRRLLKPGGIILIGIENRIGLGSFLNRVDHSGLRFTSLMPRAVASLYLRAKHPSFYRTSIDSTRGYRTYTYSPRGYVKLLREAGFDSVDLWWPPAGYNSPHCLVRLSDTREVQLHYRRDRDYKDRVNGYAFRRRLKEWLLLRTRMGAALLPEDVLIMASGGDLGARNHPHTAESLPETLSRLAVEIGPTSEAHRSKGDICHAATLSSHPLRNKSVLNFVTKAGSLRAIAKVANHALSGANDIERGFAFLQAFATVCQRRGIPLKRSLPVPITLVRIGSLIASVETPARGVRLQDLSMRHDYFADRQRVARHLDLLVSWLIAAQAALAELATSGAIKQTPTWWRSAPGHPDKPLAPLRGHISWGQHGDFFAENVFIDEPDHGLCVIDWDRVGYGYPPLFDWFCLVTSLYYTRETPRLRKGQTIDGLSFRQTYFERSWFSDLVVRLTCRISDECGLDRKQIASWFEEYLAVRCRQFHGGPASDDEVWVARYREFSDWTLGHRAECVFDPKQMSLISSTKLVSTERPGK